MTKGIVLIYTGGGIKGSVAGWPARDLTETDLERLQKEDGVSMETLIQSELYELAEKPANAAKRKIAVEKDEE